MRRDEAVECIALMQAAFPNPEIPPSSVEVWAAELQIIPDKNDVFAAIRLLTANPPRGRIIHISDVMREGEIQWADRVERESRQQRMLPSGEEGRYCTFEEYLRSRPEMRDRLKKVGMFSEIVRKAESGELHA